MYRVFEDSKIHKRKTLVKYTIIHNNKSDTRIDVVRIHMFNTISLNFVKIFQIS